MTWTASAIALSPAPARVPVQEVVTLGKVDDQRAMREARWAALNSSTKAASAGAVKAAVARRALAAATNPAPIGELCGHRSIGNKSCTREKDHQASGTKTHRYG